MWHVSSRSGVATLRTAIHLLLTYLLTLPTPVLFCLVASGGVNWALWTAEEMHGIAKVNKVLSSFYIRESSRQTTFLNRKLYSRSKRPLRHEEPQITDKSRHKWVIRRKRTFFTMRVNCDPWFCHLDHLQSINQLSTLLVHNIQGNVQITYI